MNRLLLAVLLASPLMAQVVINNFTFPTATRTGTYGPFQLTGQGGANEWLISGGNFPAGLTLSLGGSVSGTVTAAPGPYTFTVLAQQFAGGPSGTRDFTINVVAAPSLSLFSPGISLPNATGNVPYSQVLAPFFNISGGVAPYRFVQNTSLLGLTTNSQGTTISGAPRLGPGSAEISFSVVDANGATSNATFIGILILQNPLAFTTPSLPAWTVGRPYHQPVNAQGGSGFYRFTENEGNNYPPGIQPDLKLACPAFVQNPIGNYFISGQASLVGGSGPATYSLGAGSTLPPGLSFSSSGLLSGIIGGGGFFQYRVQAEDPNGLGVYRDCFLSITFAAPPPLSLSCAAPTAVIGSHYASALVVENAESQPSTFTLFAGSLPTGLTLSPGTGQILGIPSGSPGEFNYTVRVQVGSNTTDQACTLRTFTGTQDVNAMALRGVPTQAGDYFTSFSVRDGINNSNNAEFLITINPAPAFSPFSLPNGTVGTFYSSNLVPNALGGGTAPFSYSITGGTLPNGLTINSLSGIISGTPTAQGPFTFTLTATDAAGAIASIPLGITVINPVNALQITTSALPVGIVGQPYQATVLASGGTGTGYSFYYFSEPDPPGLPISSAGLINGTAPAPYNQNVSIGVVDSGSNFTTRSFLLTVTNFTCPTAIATVGSSYNSSFVLSPFSAAAYTVSSGSLPPGLILSGINGQLTGTPTVEGSYTFTTTANDTGGRQVSRSCSITTQSLIQSSSPRTTARVGVPYQSAVGATGGTSSYTHSIVAGSLPEGLFLNPSTGQITGTPQTPGSIGYRVRTQDSLGAATERDFVMYTLGRPAPPTLRCPLPSGIAGTAYNSAVSLNATGPVTYSIIAGSLPSGLTLNTATGRISGDFPLPGSTQFTVQANFPGATSGPPTAQCEIFITEAPPAYLSLACPDQQDLVRNEAYASPAIATGGRRPYSFMLYQTSLPDGLSLNPNTGLVSGTITNPSAPSSFIYILRVEDGLGFSTNSPICSGTVAAAPPVSILTTTLPAGTVGSNYNVTIQTAGGAPPLNASISGSLPAGLQLVSDSQGIRITGIPLQPGATSFSLSVSDSAQQSALRNYEILIGLADPLRFTTSFLQSATVGVNFFQTLFAAGGTPPYRFAVSGGSQAPGVTLSPDGSIRGVPTTAGTFRFVVQLTDAAGGTIEGTYSLAVFQGNFRLGCPAAQAEVGVPYNAPANIIGGSQPYSFAIAAGQLPPGLLLSQGNGTISGRPTTAGAYIFTYSVTDARQDRTQTQCSIGVVGGALRIITASPVPVRAGADYQGTLEAAGGSAPYTFALLSSAPEAGITVAANGGFTGRATRRGNFSFTVQARDSAGATATRTLVLEVGDSNLTLACPVATSFQIGVNATGRFGVTGGIAPLRFSVLEGSLPPGMVIANDGAFNIRATENGTFTAQVQAVDSTNTAANARCTFEITGTPLLITTAALPDGTVGTPYSTGVATSGAVGRVRFGLASGNLPRGLAIDGDNGAISGLPEQEGDFTVGLSATDDLRRTTVRSLSLRIADGSLPFRITTDSPLSDALVGRDYSGGFAADGGKAPYVFTIGGLPAGLTASGNSFSGTPTAAGDATVDVSARDANGATATKSFLLRVKADGLFITTEELPDGELGNPYGTGVSSQGGTPPLVWSIVRGSIPTGVTFDPSTGTFSGNPAASGPFALTLEVTDATGATSRRSYSFEVRPPGIERLSITTESLPDGSAGFAYSASIGATGGQPPYAFSINGDIPAGLSLAADGSITGTPTAIGTATFVASVTDSLGLRASRTLSLRIAADRVPSLSIEGLPETANPNQNLPFTLSIASAFPVAVSGQLTLVFAPDSHGADDPAIRFGNNSRTFAFTIPAGATQITLPSGATIATGTLAGTIRVQSTLGFGGASVPGPTRAVLLRPAAPVITSLQLTRSGSNLEVRIEGFTNTRQLSEARVNFTAAGNVDLTTSSLTVNVAQAIQNWFASAASAQFGGRFSLTLPFSVSGDASGIGGVSVTIVNSVGTSAPSSAN